jgi:hypothetical protein
MVSKRRIVRFLFLVLAIVAASTPSAGPCAEWNIGAPADGWDLDNDSSGFASSGMAAEAMVAIELKLKLGGDVVGEGAGTSGSPTWGATVAEKDWTDRTGAAVL